MLSGCIFQPTSKAVSKQKIASASLCPKLSQASLDLDSLGCPTDLGNVFCESRTAWNLEKTANNSDLSNPDNSDFGFTVKVTEGSTKRILVAEGSVIVTNSGQQTPKLSSVVVNLQNNSGKPFTVASATAVKDLACSNGSGIEGGQTCYGAFTDSLGASLVLLDSLNNDVIALSNVSIPPTPLDVNGNPVCSSAVIIKYRAEFDLDEAGLNPGDNARIEVLTTFAGAGERGKSGASCTVDVNCNENIDGDNTSTCEVNESEQKNIRTVQQRDSFVVPSCVDVCPSVKKTDAGASPLNSSCLEVNSNSLNDVIAKQGEGSETNELIEGQASCLTECETDIINSAVLECLDGRNELIEGSPASDFIHAVCEGGGPGPQVGDFCSFTQGGWGTNCSGNNPGCFRDNYFSSVFPSGAGIGEGVICSLGVCGKNPLLNGSPLFAAIWTTASAVESFLPQGVTPGTLTADLTNPVSSSSGVLDGQLLAATLSVAYDDAGKFDFDPNFSKNDSAKKLGDLIYQGGTPCDGLTVRQVITEANKFTSGEASSFTASQLNECLSLLNEGFIECDTADFTHFK